MRARCCGGCISVISKKYRGPKGVLTFCRVEKDCLLLRPNSQRCLLGLEVDRLSLQKRDVGSGFQADNAPDVEHELFSLYGRRAAAVAQISFNGCRSYQVACHGCRETNFPNRAFRS